MFCWPWGGLGAFAITICTLRKREGEERKMKHWRPSLPCSRGQITHQHTSVASLCYHFLAVCSLVYCYGFMAKLRTVFQQPLSSLHSRWFSLRAFERASVSVVQQQRRFAPFASWLDWWDGARPQTVHAAGLRRKCNLWVCLFLASARLSRNTSSHVERNHWPV